MLHHVLERQWGLHCTQSNYALQDTMHDALALNLSRVKTFEQCEQKVYLHGILVAFPDSAEHIFSLPSPPDGAA